MIPIYIPSKGRPNPKTSQLLQAEGIPHTLVVEPQDVEPYAEAGPRPFTTLLVLPESNQGISFVRNFIKFEELRRGGDWFWTIDDDISGVSQYVEKKNVRVPLRKPLEEAPMHIMADPMLAMFALEYGQFYWAAKSEFKENGFCEVFTAISARRTKALSYDPAVNMKEDRDFCLQVLSKGMKTRRWQKYGFSCPKMGSNAGGLQVEYQAKRELLAIERMVKKWPGLCRQVTKKNGVVDLKIDWGQFRH